MCNMLLFHNVCFVEAKLCFMKLYVVMSMNISSYYKWLIIYVLSSIIDKLPNSLTYEHALKHKNENISLFDLAKHFHVEVNIKEEEK